MIKHIIVTDKGKNAIPQDHPERLVLSATDFIANKAPIDLQKERKIKVINMCSNYGYLAKGYYVSLLAEARGLRCIPSVSDIVTLNWKRHYQSSLPELNTLLERHFKEPADEPLARTYTIYFGRTENEKLEQVARRLFDLFRFPLMTLEIKFSTAGHWVVEAVDPLAITNIPAAKHNAFTASLDKFTGTAWRDPNANKKAEKYWIAILHDPEDKLPPSNAAAMKLFAKAGKELGMFVETITKQDYSTLLEYDALFIRETTAINHHTFRFAHKAESEDIPCIDDTKSIIRCCNKVFLHELLQSHDIPVPKTVVIDRKTDNVADLQISYPAVVKIPDGAFSRGVVKVKNNEEFQKETAELLKKSEIILCQEFVKSDFDWRITILNGQPLFACKYYMAKGHWQIYNHEAKTTKGRDGNHECVPLPDVPEHVMNVALKSAKLVGDGLYGVDLKETDNGVVIIEVNDNPSIDHGVEDELEGFKIYRKIMERLIEMIEE